MPSDVKLPFTQIRSDFNGFSGIADLFFILNSFSYSRINLDTSRLGWCDANMCAALGAVFYSVSRGPNEISLAKMPSGVENILCKNGFLTNYGRRRLQDTYGSTIQYKRFEPKQDRVFNYYIDEQFRNKAIPDMTPTMRKKFLESLMEIFSNATIHSETKLGIFVCGQYYHQQQRLDFTIADLGIGMRKNLQETIGLSLSSDEAINWAMNGNNTTKKGPIPGGLGLKLLREYIKINRGRIQVASDTGYWQQDYDGEIYVATMGNPFPGTVVNIEINTADKHTYALNYEQVNDIPF